ncbi:transmembrane protein 120 homolog isoform X2 [Panicum hallii]|uniref:transmembrane protein 120 homolog isoform X2 n=1 Tax=Panicum hallii TaxID=206008 RepID=UPI000DF4F032|nr:transmembrane protein 120 homolog isoform X2 [Panicum hallii]
MAWLLFLYTSFALRENVLIVNGSDIRPWWIYHHYLAMVMALVSLTWEIKGQPDCYSKQGWNFSYGGQSCKAKRMDVVAGETAGVEGQLLLLYPVLFVLQGFEAYVGVLLLQTALHGLVAGCFLRDLAGDNGSGQLRQHYGDTDTKIEVQSEDEESKEQAGSPSSKLMKYHK